MHSCASQTKRYSPLERAKLLMTTHDQIHWAIGPDLQLHVAYPFFTLLDLLTFLNLAWLILVVLYHQHKVVPIRASGGSARKESLTEREM